MLNSSVVYCLGDFFLQYGKVFSDVASYGDVALISRHLGFQEKLAIRDGAGRKHSVGI
ncbi:MAG: hypothetical protein KA524_01950 [Nitrosomonas sp.]|nr:hypothetical protein [Nitrosomonas sp.]MBP6074970.1 hypothetical protein [Nitrosomonas sp.]